jgi:hypothetical protein
MPGLTSAALPSALTLIPPPPYTQVSFPSPLLMLRATDTSSTNVHA